jgi:hypothetical protein
MMIPQSYFPLDKYHDDTPEYFPLDKYHDDTPELFPFGQIP